MLKISPSTQQTAATPDTGPISAPGCVPTKAARAPASSSNRRTAGISVRWRNVKLSFSGSAGPRLDPVFGPVRVDERHHHLARRSSSAWTKKADALRRISLARLSSRFSRSSSLSHSRSELVIPTRSPWSRSARRTHLRKVSGVQPILFAIEPIAAHWDACSPWCSNTSRTARSRTSGEYLVDLFITPSSQEMESPVNPGRFKVASAPRHASQ